MAKGNVVAGLSEEQYAEIELAVMESERGRTFLKEYLARNRTSDTRMLLDAISRLESALCLKAMEHEGGEQYTPALAEIASVVTATRTEIAAIRNDLIAGGGALAQSPDAFTTAAEQANSLSADLLSQVEQVENLAWKIRELGVDTEVCDKLDVCVEELMALCWKQDVSGQRAAKALSVLQYVNDRTGGNLVSLGADGDNAKMEALAAPADAEDAVSTDEDAYFAEDAELFDENAKAAQPLKPVAVPAPGLAYAEPTVEDELSSDAIVAEEAPADQEVTQATSPDASEAVETSEPAGPEHLASVPETPQTSEPTGFSAKDLIEEPKEMSGPANLKGFTEMATSINANGPFNTTTLAQMVTPTETSKPDTPASNQESSQAKAVEPFQVELDNLAKKDGFAFNTEGPAKTDTVAKTETKPSAEANAADEENNGHIVIIRTPSEPEAKTLPEPVTQEKPSENGEVPLVVISPPEATSA